MTTVDAPVVAAANPPTASVGEKDLYVKVFVGNLPYRINTTALKDFFADAGTVVDTQLIRKQGRSMGFGFVSFKTTAEATTAVDLFHQKEFDGRAINVEIAQSKPHVPAAEGGIETSRPRVRKPKSGEEAVKTEDGHAKTAIAPAAGSGLVDGDAIKPKRIRKPKSAKASGHDERKPVVEGEHAKSADEESKPAASAKRAPRPPRPPRIREGEPSKTTIFIGNLPFKVSSDDILVIFKDYKVKSAHVVMTKFGRSKGYGFMEMESASEQERVLADVSDVKVEDRTLIVRAAYSVPAAPEGDNEAVPVHADDA
ncbi:hypothetical protein MT418_001965 [Batrachochytrium dendrobatidis]